MEKEAGTYACRRLRGAPGLHYVRYTVPGAYECRHFSGVFAIGVFLPGEPMQMPVIRLTPTLEWSPPAERL